MRIFSAFFILLGIITLIFASYLYIQRINPYKLSFNNAPQVEYKTTSAIPIRVMINDLSIDVPVKMAKKEGNKWQSFSDAISFLSSSPIPGDEGNSILYGHNWKNLLGDLKKARVGQEIKIIFSNGSEKSFVTGFIQEVSPDQTSILDKSMDSRITLYTCSGFLDSKRFVVVATLQS